MASLARLDEVIAGQKKKMATAAASRAAEAEEEGREKEREAASRGRPPFSPGQAATQREGETEDIPELISSSSAHPVAAAESKKGRSPTRHCPALSQRTRIHPLIRRLPRCGGSDPSAPSSSSAAAAPRFPVFPTAEMPSRIAATKTSAFVEDARVRPDVSAATRPSIPPSLPPSHHSAAHAAVAASPEAARMRPNALERVSPIEKVPKEAPRDRMCIHRASKMHLLFS